MPPLPSPPPLERPIVAVDVVVFALDRARDGLAVLLARRKAAPFAGALALPGVAVRIDETLQAAARRALQEKGRLEGETRLHLEQLCTFDALYRDPRGRTVSVAYLGLCRAPARPGLWRRTSSLEPQRLPFDHAAILEAALGRLRGKLRYTNIAGHLLPDTFRIEELQRAYEAILGRELNRANFRSKLLRLGLIEQVGVLSEGVSARGGRPAHLYRFTREQVLAEERDFI